MNKNGFSALFALLAICLAVVNLAAPGQAPTTGAPVQNPAAPPPPAAPPDPQDPRYKLNVDVQLVNVTATVLDDAGKYIDGLKQDDFQLYEDGSEQKISFFSHDLRVPVSVGVLVDNSGSMRHKLQQALQTVREIAAALSAQDEMFLITFNSDVNLKQRFTSNSSEVQKSLRDIRSSGETAAYDAIDIAVQEMKNARNTKKILILVTDGFDTKSRINADKVEDILKRSEVLVYAIGIDDDENDPLVLRRTRYHIYHYMLAKLTGVSGGRAFRFFTGRNYALNSIAQVLMEELHQQYTLGYYPTSATDGQSWKKLEVKIRKAGAQIRHRAGYYIGQPTMNQPD